MTALHYILISLVLKAVFAYIYPLIDVKLYKERYEDKRLTNWFLKFLFTKKDLPGFPGALPYYRVFQFMIQAVYWIAAWFIFYKHISITVFIVDAVVGLIWAFYWMKHEREYYRIAKQDYLLDEYRVQWTDVYWLKRWWYSGRWIFRKSYYGGFTTMRFNISAGIGTAGYYLTTLIYLI
jgi:hypothetical protein